MKKISGFIAALLAFAIAGLCFAALANIEAGRFNHAFHCTVPAIAAGFFFRYIRKKDALATIRELVMLAYERSPKVVPRGTFRRNAKAVFRYLSPDERDKYRKAKERVGCG